MADYTELLPDPLPAEPLTLVSQWLAQAEAARTQPNPNAMVLATSTREGRPSARVVLCKDIVPQPGFVVFYTNYLSVKGRQLKDNPRAAVVMHWDVLHRQVRIEGPVVAAPESDSNTYFATRAWQSRIGAWASEQSRPLPSDAALSARVAAFTARFEAGDVPRPPHWSGRSSSATTRSRSRTTPARS